MAKTGADLVDQWKSEFMALALPFSIPRVVGGADYPLKKRFRIYREAAVLTPWECTRMHARRVESNIKSDWNIVPAQKNLTTHWDAWCGDGVACKHAGGRAELSCVPEPEG